MAGPDIALGLTGAVDVAIKWGNIFVKTCSAYRNADSEIYQHVLRVELCCYQTRKQLEFLRRVWAELDAEYQLLLEETLIVLTTTLSIADQRLRNLQKNNGPDFAVQDTPSGSKVKKKDKVVYALIKESLSRTLDDMELWQRRFDCSWLVMLRVESPVIDQELHSADLGDKSMRTASRIRDSLAETPKQSVHLSLPEKDLETATIKALSLTTVETMQRLNSTKVFLLDSIECATEGGLDERRKAIRDLTRKLAAADPFQLALLRCAGFVTSQKLHQFTLVFTIPEGMTDPRSLRSLLVSQEQKHTLSDQFRLATQLATAVCSLHTLEFVHKNIRPENVLMLQDRSSPIGSGFLLGFDHARPEEGRTRLVSDTDWQRNIYRHPQRQGERLDEPYIMQHDIYSLGVCLLEIGLWMSFVQYPVDFARPTPSEEYKLSVTSGNESPKAEVVKSELLALARDSLPRQMGTKYAKVVQTCLTCLDEDSNEFGNQSEFKDPDEVLVAVRYIRKILSQLTAITV